MGQLCPVPVPVPIGTLTGALSHAVTAGCARQPPPATNKRHRERTSLETQPSAEHHKREGKPRSFGCKVAVQPVQFCTSGSAAFILFPASKNRLITSELGVSRLCAERDGRSQAGGEGWKGSPDPAGSTRVSGTASPCTGSLSGFAGWAGPWPPPAMARTCVPAPSSKRDKASRPASHQPQQIFLILRTVTPTT